MYVKLYNRILDSSLAENRPLRHFFTDLLLCADLDGMVIMTREAISKRTGANMEEVEWGLTELQKPDEGSLSPDHDGRRIVPLDGHGYGWQIVNFEEYRDLKSAAELRSKAKQRMKRYREKKASEKSSRGPDHSGAERAFVKSIENDEPEEKQNAIVERTLPELETDPDAPAF